MTKINSEPCKADMFSVYLKLKYRTKQLYCHNIKDID